MKRLFLLACLIATPAAAATPDSWAALDKDAREACGKEIVRLASKARVTGVAGKVSGIGVGQEADRHYALILTGTTAGFRSQWLCLYDKRSRKVSAREVEK